MASHSAIERTDHTPLRALIYARVSLDVAGEGRSVARQIDACRSLADARDYVVVGVETDTQSAYADRKRPGWERAKAAAERGEVDVVLGWQLDRITRSMRELEQLIELTEATGVAVATVSGEMDLTTSNGRLLARILGAVARAESEMRASRQKLANLDRARRGVPRRNASQLFGYDGDGEVIEAEAKAIQSAARDVLNGTVRLTDIGRRWNAAGLLPHRRGVPDGDWTLRGIQLLLVNPRLAGLSTYRGQVVGRGDWRPILRVGTHEKLVSVLVDNRRRTGSPTKTLLAGIAFCQRCGAKHTATFSSRGRLAYVCRNRHAHIRRDRADAVVMAALIGIYGPRFEAASLDEQRAMVEEAVTVAISTGSRYGPRQTLLERVQVTPRITRRDRRKPVESGGGVAALGVDRLPDRGHDDRADQGTDDAAGS